MKTNDRPETIDRIQDTKDKRNRIKKSRVCCLLSEVCGLNKGFTFIELLITLTVIAISFLPLMRMFSVGLEQSYVSNDLTTGRYLAQEGMERVKNLALSKEQLETLGDTWDPPLEKEALLVNDKKWRTGRFVIRGTDPLEVRIKVYQVSGPEEEILKGKPIVELVTLVEDLDWLPVE